ncbi:hypothetical protein TESG_04639 [Trichophyton tonsurans CBS 112818]|uniref:Rhodopsin domain-containing protein n=1 Tax=Trichophyton tonsurans (strain CBS 112818) TaxID=647933 RepID=F2S0X8_TRIT1|nr:hypothetical protein TESG_04639 [Trichophyton tonsurans CBS 112818]
MLSLLTNLRSNRLGLFLRHLSTSSDMLVAPPEVIASWPKPNYVNPEHQGLHLMVVVIGCFTISSVVVALRTYVRVKIKRNVGWDDWLMLSTLPLLAGITVSNIIGVYHGWGYHIWDNKPEWGVTCRLTSWCSQIMSVIVATMVKSSILISYMRFFSNTATTLRQGTWIMLHIVVAWGLGISPLLIVYQKQPLSDYWNDPTRRNCINNGARIISGSIPHVLTDIIIWMLPIPTLCKMHLPGREKVVLIILMSFGLVACAASVVRLAYTYVILYVSYDSTWVGYNLWIWNDLEVNLAVICASFPMLRPLARMYLPNWGSNIFTTSADSLPMEAQPSGQKKMNLVLPEWKHDEESVPNEKSANLAPISGLDEKIKLKVPEQAVHSTKQKL